MSELFLEVVSRSLSASWLVLFVLILRFMLQNTPKWVRVLLWGMVAFRLICPFAIESSFSLVPQSLGNGELIEKWTDDYIGDIDIHHPESVYYNAAVGAGREPISDGEGGYYVVTKHDQLGEPSTVRNTVIPVLSAIWLIGMLVLAVYTGSSYWSLQRKVSEAVLYKDNIFQSEYVSSPFVLGIIKPRIYIPFKIDGMDLEHVIAHEKAHIKRNDHVWKPFGFLLLTIHWFNPLMWLSYGLLCRDIELACDEKVICELDNEARADYTQALVKCSVNRQMAAVCPLAFGEVGVKERVQSVLNYKKPRFWMVLVAVMVCVVAGVGLLTNPKQQSVENVEVRIEDSAVEDTIKDIAYHLELATLGKEFTSMDEHLKSTLLSEYKDLLDGYSLIARESVDGKAKYIVGVYEGNPKESPLYQLDSMERSETTNGEVHKEYQLLYAPEEKELVYEEYDMAGVGYVLDNSRISNYKGEGIILIEPEGTSLSLHDAMFRYFIPGREYIQDAAARGISIIIPEEPYLSVYFISEKYGEITENIPLNAGQATDIFKGERMDLKEGVGLATALHMDGETYYYGGDKDVPKVAVELVTKQCGYKFETLDDIYMPIKEAKLEWAKFEEPLYADADKIERLQEILTNAKFGGVGKCGYGAKLTVTLKDGNKVVMFKGTDGCDTIVFGSYGGYTLGDEENKEFWEIFGLDAETKELIGE